MDKTGISYELAKELKDAGFPQNAENRVALKNGYDYAYPPTLPELIEACGDIEFELHCYPFTKFDARYFVIERLGEDDMERQPTPEIAVAKLYLALHKH
jgi:hypothetical protein